MTLQQAKKLADKIEREDPQCRCSLRHYADGGVSIDLTDTRTGYTAVVSSSEEWEERKAAAETALC